MKRSVFYGLALFMGGALAQAVPSATPLVPRLSVLDQQGFLQLLVARSAEVAYSQLNTEVTRRLMQGEASLYEVTFFMGVREEGRNRQRTAGEIKQSLITADTNVLEENGRSDVLGVRSRLPWGSELSLSYSPSNKTNNLIPQYNLGKSDTEYNTLLSLTFKQPMLRNAGRSVTETDRKIADLEHTISLKQLTQQLLKTSIDGLNLYWQLHRAEATLLLRQNAMTSAQALLADAKARSKAGKLSALAVLDLQGVLLNRQAEVTRSQQALREAQGKLASALNLIWHDENPLTTSPRWVQMDSFSVSEPMATEDALQQWAPYQVAQLKQQQAQIRLNYASNQTQPVFDLVMGYNGTGYENTKKDARNTALKGQFPDWYVGVNLEIMLQGNQKARQQYFAQNARVSQARLEIRAIETSFSNDWGIRRNDLITAQQVLNSSREEVKLRQSVYDIEFQRHQIGVGLHNFLIQKQVDLIEAQQRLLENKIRFEVAFATLQYTKSSLLSDHHIDLKIQAQAH